MRVTIIRLRHPGSPGSAFEPGSRAGVQGVPEVGSELDSGLKRAGMTSFEYLEYVALIYASKYWNRSLSRGTRGGDRP